MPTPFRIDFVAIDGSVLGNSSNIIDLNDVIKLDQIGELKFSLPSSDPLTAYLQAGLTFEIYDSKDGYLGHYIFKDKEIDDKLGVAITKVTCYDSLQELTYDTVGFNRFYNHEPVVDVIQDVISLANGWQVDVEAGLETTTIDYQGESIFRAIDEQRDRNSTHFRLKQGFSRYLEFGFFGEISETVFTTLRGQTQVDSAPNETIAVINSLNLLEESSEIYNKIIPLGHGQGVNQLTIEQASLGDYTKQIGTNADGSFYYYFEDQNSINLYGRKTRVLSFPNLRPISNSDADIINAANALKLSAEAYLNQHSQPKKTYSIEVVILPASVKVGDLIRVIYKGQQNGIQYLNVDDYFYVMEISRNRDATGSRNYSLTISNLNNKRTTDQDIIVDVVRDLKNINVHIPATITYAPVNGGNKRIRGSGFADARVNAEFKVRIRDEVLYLNRAIMHLATSPLKSSVRVTASGGSSAVTSAGGGDHGHIIGQLVNNAAGGYTNRRITLAMGGNFAAPTIVNADIALNDTVSGVPDDYIITATASGDHTHTIDLPPHTHEMVYDVYEDTTYPSILGIKIDGIDYTGILSIEQNNSLVFAPSNNAYEYELDITSILNLNLKQIHTIVIYADQGLGEVECEVDMMVTIQPVRID